MAPRTAPPYVNDMNSKLRSYWIYFVFLFQVFHPMAAVEEGRPEEDVPEAEREAARLKFVGKWRNQEKAISIEIVKDDAGELWIVNPVNFPKILDKIRLSEERNSEFCSTLESKDALGFLYLHAKEQDSILVNIFPNPRTPTAAKGVFDPEWKPIAYFRLFKSE